jgi:glutamate dehydrogenase (NAD(P)+)
MELSEEIRERCKWPKRLITVTMPVHMDDGSTRVFFGHRVQHHLSRGPVRGDGGGFPTFLPGTRENALHH